ncbi:hypothetical protein CTAYLR_000545 [Chrysophaeum taylorii]|uniref:4a-hydroxytetrahydrobiopterin dehydratase n=1 Tax=Chrysophaeum taylorii TaxID=2483200 RepID=A0AAD7UIC2_9STRA|nr:hypothetical protein CTAYLR_000545 [Chrysophaeum taylorii]
MTCRGPILKNVREALESQLASWVLAGDERSIARSFVAKDWAAAMRFVCGVSEAAEAANHHPDIHLTEYRKVKVVLSTHSVGGLTQQDIDLAHEIDAVPVEYSKKWLSAQRPSEAAEFPSEFDRSHFANGLNADFFQQNLDEFLGKGGKFEDPELRDIAAAREDIVSALKLTKKSVVADVGAGSGILVPLLLENAGRVVASEISPGFRKILRGTGAEVVDASETNPNLPDGIDLALLVDVYHHLEYPRTVLRHIRSKLKNRGTLAVIDFHRDPSKVTSHDADWVLGHVRADQATFTREIESVGFTLVADLKLDSLPENYFLFFNKRPLPHDIPGVGWTSGSS